MMKIKFSFSLLFLFLTLQTATFAQTGNLKKFAITKDMSVMLPSNFNIMPDEGIAKKYPSHIKPLAVFTDPSGLVDFSVTEKPITFGADDLPLLQKLYKSAIVNKFTEVNFLREEIAKVNRQEHIIFEFVSTVKDEKVTGSSLAAVKKYTHVHYVVRNGKLYIFTLNIPFSLKPKWEEQATEVMNSIKM